jgi:hypothetical protein
MLRMITTANMCAITAACINHKQKGGTGLSIFHHPATSYPYNNRRTMLITLEENMQHMDGVACQV